MKLRELISEGVSQVWSRKGSKSVRKYRCTSGSRKGRVVAKASTCTKPIDLKKSASFKKTKALKGTGIKIKSKRTKRANPASKRLKRINLKPRKR